MSKCLMRKVISLGMVFLLGLSALIACGGGNDDKEQQNPTSSESLDPVTSEPLIITIGNHTDMTGIAANAMADITMALEDMAAYYNDSNLIPGVKLKVITWDNQYNPERDKAGYEWLKERGADVLWGNVASTAVTLKSILEQDGVVFFTAAPATDAFIPPGWVFACGNTLVQWESAALLKWVAENDPDFPKDRVAKVGGAFWNESYGADCLAGAKEYAMAHPEQYEWEGGYLSDFSFLWTTEVEALMDCDYVLTAVPMNQFVKQYRDAGGTAKFLGTDAHIAFLGQVRDDGLFDEIDGMYIVKPSRWWNDEGEIIALSKEILQTYRPNEAERLIQSGSGYLATQQIYQMLEIIKEAVATVGVENFNSRAIYDVARSFSINVDGCPHSYDDTKHTSNDGLAIYEIRANEDDLFRVSSDWIPVLYEP